MLVSPLKYYQIHFPSLMMDSSDQFLMTQEIFYNQQYITTLFEPPFQCIVNTSSSVYVFPSMRFLLLCHIVLFHTISVVYRTVFDLSFFKRAMNESFLHMPCPLYNPVI